MTPDEMKDLCDEKMGKKLGAIFYELRNELDWLHVKWGQYQQLFGEKPERIDLLHEAASLFFHVIEETLSIDTLLHLARLVDPPESQKNKDKPNLTVCALPAMIGDDNAELRDEVSTLVGEAKARTAFAVDWRNRRIAHRDLRVALKEPLHELAPASRLQVRHALEALAAVLNRVEDHYLVGDTGYDFSRDPGDATAMLMTLRSGLEAQRDQRARMSRAEPLESDLHGIPPI